MLVSTVEKNHVSDKDNNTMNPYYLFDTFFFFFGGLYINVTLDNVTLDISQWVAFFFWFQSDLLLYGV